MTLHGCVRAEITRSAAHAYHEVLAWLRVTLCWRDMWAPRRKGVAFTVASLLCLWVSQERINVSAVPMAPRVFFQLLSSSLAYPGFSNSVNSKTLASGAGWGSRQLDLHFRPFWSFQFSYVCYLFYGTECGPFQWLLLVQLKIISYAVVEGSIL